MLMIVSIWAALPAHTILDYEHLRHFVDAKPVRPTA
jgi:hypothetical protein